MFALFQSNAKAVIVQSKYRLLKCSHKSIPVYGCFYAYTKLKFLSVKWSYYKLWFLAVLCYRLYQYSFSHRLTQSLALCMEQKKPSNWCIQLIITLKSCFQMLKPMNTINLIYFLLFSYFLPMAWSSCLGSSGYFFPIFTKTSTRKESGHTLTFIPPSSASGRDI